MKELVVNAVVFAGFLAGGYIGGGMIGSIVGGIAAFIGVLFVSEQLEAARSIEGFWLRHRGSLVIFLATIGCVVAGMAIFGQLLGIVGGIFAGQFVGDAIAEKLGWGGLSLEGQLEFRYAYVSVLASAANADGVVSEKEHCQILAIAKNLFSSLGYGDDTDTRPLVDNAIADPVGPHDVGAYLNQLDPEFQQLIFLDMCKVLFADGEMSPEEVDWFHQFQQTARIEDMSALTLFTRAHMFSDDRRNDCLTELGLSSNATDDEIKRAYKKLAMKYHPDKQESMPSHARELIAKKMVALNDAFAFLTNKSNSVDLSFQCTGGKTFTPTENEKFECLCWLCSQRLNVPAVAAPESVRCPKCHALAGLAFDPNLTP
ncbi:MAG: DnaJ domain-containing protein [Planctomycetaceae bacterium]